MADTRRLGAAALLGALALALTACSPSGPPDGPDLAAGDVITLGEPQVMPDGYYGVESIVITEDTVSGRFVLPDGSEIFSVERELAPEDRESLETAAEAYLEWEPGVSVEERTSCMDIGDTTVEVFGSLTHESSMQDCSQETPLRELTTLAEDTWSEGRGPLVRPFMDWSVEIRPWAGDGPDESATVESYLFRRGIFPDGLQVIAQNAPDGWGTSLTAEDDYAGDERYLAPWALSGPVLSDLNEMLLEPDAPGCDAPTGEIRVIRQLPYDDSEVIATRPLCPGQPSTDVAETLRGL